MRISDWSSDVCSSDLRQRRQVKGIVGRDRQLAARNVRLVGRAAGRDQDVLGTMSLAVDLDRVRIAQSRMTTDQPGAGVRQQLAVDAIDTRDLAILVVTQGRPVEAGRANRPDRKSTRLNSSHYCAS